MHRSGPFAMCLAAERSAAGHIGCRSPAGLSWLAAPTLGFARAGGGTRIAAEPLMSRPRAPDGARLNRGELRSTCFSPAARLCVAQPKTTQDAAGTARAPS